MEYISAEEFLKQHKEVQNVLIEWWKPTLGDLYTCDNNGTLKVINEDIESELELDKDFLKNTIHCFNSLTDKIVPLLTEGQLRKFIEDKTRYKAEINYYEINGYDLSLTEGETNYFNYLDLGHDLLQAYWKVACEIAKEELNND